MSDPLVTVVIPCHNHARWVNDAIDSVVAQDYPSKRVVVVDDGSEDGSAAAVCFRLQNLAAPTRQSEPEVHWGDRKGTHVMVCRFRQARGPSFARNYGIRAGWDSTDVFAFLDSDDLYLPCKLSRSVEKWKEAPHHVGAVYTDYETFDERTGVRVRQYKEPFSRERLVRECLPNMDSLVSKQALEQCGGFDEDMRVAEDYDLWMRISEKFMIVHLAEPLLAVRVGDHSSTAGVPREVWERNWRRVMQKAQARASGRV